MGIRVSVKPIIYSGVPGWRVGSIDPVGPKRLYPTYFVKTVEAVKHVRGRLKAGKRPTPSWWAVKLG